MKRPQRLLALAFLSSTYLACGDDDDSHKPHPGVTVVDSAGLKQLADSTPTSLEYLAIGGPDFTVTEVVLPGVVTIEGNLEIIASPALTRVSLPNLQRIGSRLFITHNDLLEELELPELREADQVFVSQNDALGSLQLPNLTTAAWLSVEDNAGLQAILAEQLTTTTEDNALTLSVEDNWSLQDVSLPSVTKTDLLSVKGNHPLIELDLTSLVSVDSLAWLELEAVRSLALPALERCAELTLSAPGLRDLDLTALRVINTLWLESSSLQTLNLPSLEEGPFLHIHVPGLRQFAAPQLTTVDTLTIRWDWLEYVDLPVLTESCTELPPIPDCAAEVMLPNCTDLQVIEGCTCSAEPNLQLAECPAPQG